MRWASSSFATAAAAPVSGVSRRSTAVIGSLPSPQAIRPNTPASTIHVRMIILSLGRQTRPSP
ncbi:hypothetical protein AI27_02545 [Sphingomonas sp. BHC-A]|nr:hypothetical protein AI27_02545 [Sphingomonas sp. BHC-A]